MSTATIYEFGQLVNLQGNFYSDVDETETADPDDVVLSIRDPARNITTPTPVRASTGVWTYAWTPTIPGLYEINWTGTGAVVSADQEAIYVKVGIDVGSDLCTLAQAKSMLRKGSSANESADDDALQPLITAASAAITAYCSREFTPMGTLTRRFQIDTPLVDFGKYDLVSIASVTTSPGQQWAVTLVQDADFTLEPANLSILGTYNQLRISRWETFRIRCTRHPFGYVPLDITGDWGAPSIPAIVSQACAVTVAEWYRSKIAAMSTVFNDDGVHVVPAPLPTMVCGWLEPFLRYQA